MTEIGGARISNQFISLDFSFSALFGKAYQLSQDDFQLIENPIIKDQGNSDMCVAYATTSLIEDVVGVPLSAEYLFSRIKEIEGNVKSFGADIRDGLKAAIEYGTIVDADSPFHFPESNRDFIAEPSNWPVMRDTIKMAAYFDCDSGLDLFDSIRDAMLKHKRSVEVEYYWQPEWSAGNGIIQEQLRLPFSRNVLHAFKIIGQKNIGSELYLIAQLSSGTKVGKGGLFYFPRYWVNKFLCAYILVKDVNPEEMKDLLWSPSQKVFHFLVQLIRKIKAVIN